MFFICYVYAMWPGRKKKERNVCIDFESMLCNCFWPLKVSQELLESLEKVIMEPDELQTLVYQDQDGLTMDEACKKLGVSKTVYAGIYKRARKKVVDSLINNKILIMNCEQSQK